MPRSIKRCLPLACAFLAAAAVLLFWLWGAIRRVVPVELNQELPPASAFVRLGLGKHAAYGEQSPAGINTAQPGEYSVTVMALGLTREATLRVADSTPPQAIPQDRVGIVGMSGFSPDDFILEYSDSSAVKARFAEPIDLTKRGRQTVTILLEDAYGNQSKLKAKLRLLRLRDPLQFEIGKTPDPLPPQSLFNEPRRDEISMEFLQPPADCSTPGEQPVRLRLDGFDYTLNLRMADTIAPYGKTEALHSYVGATVEPEAFFTQLSDATPITLRYLSPPDMTRTGRQTVEIELSDMGGNRSTYKVKLNLSLDDQPPVITGVHDIYVTTSGSIAYRKDVSVSDDSGEIELIVDSSAVDPNTPGVYAVTYSAADPAGNTTSITAQVYVSQASEDEVKALAQPILEEIISPGMSDEEKAFAIHTWIRNNIAYNNTGDKNGVIDGAHNGFLLRRGDCYTYYALAKFMLDLLDIPSVDMRRIDGTPTRHYWLLLNFGEGWHHYDTCPVRQTALHPNSGFMITDEEAQAFGEAIGKPYYYQFDPAILPAGIAIQ